jgi:hypothetical protein
MTSYAPHRSDLSTDRLLGHLLWGLSECTRLEDERGLRPPTPLLDVFAITFKSPCNMKLLVRRENWVVGPTPAQLLSN